MLQTVEKALIMASPACICPAGVLSNPVDFPFLSNLTVAFSSSQRMGQPSSLMEFVQLSTVGLVVALLQAVLWANVWNTCLANVW